MEKSDSNDYYLSYSQEFTKRKKKRSNDTNYDLYYGNQLIVENRSYAMCKAQWNKRIGDVNFKLQKFDIRETKTCCTT